MAISQDSVVVSGCLQIGFCGIESACLRIAHVPSSSLNIQWFASIFDMSGEILQLITKESQYLYFPKAKFPGVDNDSYFEPHLALFAQLQQAYPNYKKQFIYA